MNTLFVRKLKKPTLDFKNLIAMFGTIDTRQTVLQKNETH